jgi:hypothetical protein
MNRMTTYRSLGLLIAITLAACSGKKDAPSPAPAAAGPRAESKKATLDCDDRTVVLEATCVDLYGPQMLACTKQSLAVVEHASSATQSVRAFATHPGTDGDPATVEEKIGALACVRGADNGRYIVADLFNGGNCEQCEWHELYDWNGKLVGSDRDRKKPNALLTELVNNLPGKAGQVIARKELDGFYSAGTP